MEYSRVAVSSQDMFCHESLDLVQELDQLVAQAHSSHTIEVEAARDPVVLGSARVLTNMLEQERTAESARTDYCNTIQTSIAPHMRKIVTDWMLEVCQDHQCQPQVFFLAVNYLDRFLSSVAISKTQFQLCAAVCILLASKFSQVVPISTEKLALYTDHSVTTEELRLWEVQVLAVLEWELSSVTAHSFLEQLTSRAELLDNRTLVSHAETLAALAATEYKFVLARQSVLAAAALAAACRHQVQSPQVFLQTVKACADLVRADITEIIVCATHLLELPFVTSTAKTVDPEPGRPLTPDDMLNISQTEIVV